MPCNTVNMGTEGGWRVMVPDTAYLTAGSEGAIEVVDQFFGGLNEALEALFACDSLRDSLPYELAQASRLMSSSDRAMHYEVCFYNPLEYSWWADKILTSAKLLTKNPETAGEYELALDWLLTAPRRLLGLVRQGRDYPQDWDSYTEETEWVERDFNTEVNCVAA